TISCRFAGIEGPSGRARSRSVDQTASPSACIRADGQNHTSPTRKRGLVWGVLLCPAALEKGAAPAAARAACGCGPPALGIPAPARRRGSLYRPVLHVPSRTGLPLAASAVAG